MSANKDTTPYILLSPSDFEYIEETVALTKFRSLRDLLSARVKYHGKSVPAASIQFRKEVRFIEDPDPRRPPSSMGLQAAIKTGKKIMVAHYDDEAEIVELYHALFAIKPSAVGTLYFSPKWAEVKNDNDRLIKFLAVHECFHYLRHHTNEWSRATAPENRFEEEYLVNRLAACAYLGDASHLKCGEFEGLRNK